MKTKLILIACTLGLFSACTQNQRARYFGGTATIDLPANTKFVSVTWKDDQLWYIHRPMRSDESAEIVTLQEDASFGMVEGKVIFRESK